MGKRKKTKLDWDEVAFRIGDGPAQLLVGNGFSIVCWPGFAYRTLLEVAALEDDGTAARAFEALGSQDFEEVIDKIDQAESLIEAVGGSKRSQMSLHQASHTVRTKFLEALSNAHPATPGAVDRFGLRARCAGRFLDLFDHIFTLNYDLLLPWLAMRSDASQRRLTDGFSNETGPLQWKKGRRQRLWFLHGALHLFDDGPDVLGKAKYEPGRTLVDQLRDRIADDRWPLVVFEGTAEQKKRRIEAHAYLRQGMRRLSEVGGSLVVFGASFADSDAHIRTLLARQKNVHTIYVSTFDSLACARRLREAVDDEKGDVEVVAFSAQSVPLWLAEDG